MKKLSSFLRKGSIFLTGLLITIFTGITAIQGIITKSADGILINTAKFSIDNFVPIVGGFAADSLEMVISCIGLIKNAIGIIGIIIILSMLIVPVIKLLSVAVIYKVIAIAAEPIATKDVYKRQERMSPTWSILRMISYRCWRRDRKAAS